MPHRILNGVCGALGVYAVFTGVEHMYYYATTSESTRAIYTQATQTEFIGPVGDLAQFITSNPLITGIAYTIGGLAFAGLAYASHTHHKKNYIHRKHLETHKGQLRIKKHKKDLDTIARSR